MTSETAIPREIINLVAEASAEQNDGFARNYAREKLADIRSFIGIAIGATGRIQFTELQYLNFTEWALETGWFPTKKEITEKSVIHSWLIPNGKTLEIEEALNPEIDL